MRAKGTSSKGTIYADYQATTRVDPRVVEKMMPFWEESFGNPHSNDHIVGWQAAEAVRESQESVASLIGADPDEIVFTSGATEANNLALFGLARRATDGRARILVSAIEHKCVLAAATALEAREGFVVETIPVDAEGIVDLEALQGMLDKTVLVVSIMAVNNEVGTIQDMAHISSLLRERGILFHCDAAQAPCAMDMSGFAGHADLISLSGHKAYGPQGIGALYIRREVQPSIEPIIHGGGQQDGLRSGTVPLPLCVGMAAAMDVLRAEGAEERKRVARQRNTFVSLVASRSGSVVVNGPAGSAWHPGNANLRFEGVRPKMCWGRCSLGSPRLPGLPAPQTYRSHPTCSEQWALVQNRLNPQYDSASGAIPRMTKSKKLPF